MMSEFMYEDTFAPNWPDDQRISYALIMLRLSDLCKNYCRSKIHSRYVGKQRRGWSPGEDELAWAYEQMDSSYMPIEALMLEVAHMILDGGRSFESEQWMNYHHAKMQAILQKNDLQAMLAELPQPERDYFVSDLKLLEPLGLFGSWLE
jgi:hypothetical protein